MCSCSTHKVRPERIANLTEYFESITVIHNESRLVGIIEWNELDYNAIFQEACRQVIPKVILALLHLKYSVLSPTSINMALVYSATYNDMEVLNILNENGAYSRITDHHIRLAQEHGYKQIVDHMLRTPIDVMTEDMVGLGLVNIN